MRQDTLAYTLGTMIASAIHYSNFEELDILSKEYLTTTTSTHDLVGQLNHFIEDLEDYPLDVELIQDGFMAESKYFNWDKSRTQNLFQRAISYFLV